MKYTVKLNSSLNMMSFKPEHNSSSRNRYLVITFRKLISYFQPPDTDSPLFFFTIFRLDKKPS